MSFSEEPTEEEIQKFVNQAKAGDMRSYEVLVRHFSPKLVGMVYGMTKSEHDAQDVVQDSMIRAYKALGRYEAKASFYTWLYRIAYNQTLNFLKAKKRKRLVSMNEIEENVGLSGQEYVDQSVSGNPERQMEVNHLQKRLNDALMRLSEKHRAVVTMFDVEGLPHAKIAEVLGVSEGTVRSRLHYAHRELQNFLSEN